MFASHTRKCGLDIVNVIDTGAAAFRYIPATSRGSTARCDEQAFSFAFQFRNPTTAFMGLVSQAEEGQAALMQEVGYRHISRRAPQAGSGRISTGGVGRILLPVCSERAFPKCRVWARRGVRPLGGDSELNVLLREDPQSVSKIQRRPRQSTLREHVE